MPAAGSLRADELRILALLAQGLAAETVARRLELSERTLRRRTRGICDQLGVRTPMEAVVWAARRGLV